MQDQGKRLLLAVGLALAVMFAWQTFFGPPPKKPTAPPAVGSAASGGATDGSAPAAPALPMPAAAPRGPEQKISLAFPNVEVTFSSYGGVLAAWHLTDKRYDHDKSRGDLIPAQPDAGAFAVNVLSGASYELPGRGEWQGKQVSDREVVYTIESPTLLVEKRFLVIPESYVVELKVTVTAKTEASRTLVVSTYGYQDPKDSGGGGQSIAPRRWESATFRKGEHRATTVGAVQKSPRFEYDLNWTGFEHPYLLAALAPRPQPGTAFEKQTVAEGSGGLMRTDVLVKPAVLVKPGDAALVREFVAYLGPKNYKELEAADGVAHFSTELKHTIDLGWFGFIGRPLLWLLLEFYAFFQNWGIAIVLLTILVKAVTIPFTTRSMRSMKVMAVLAPQMKVLQEKYKDDKQRLQMETMALYKQHGANPLTGCLPLLLQMPIWLALYRMLSSAGELYQQPFIHGWIDDLTNSDPLHILPVVLMVTMFAQARLTPTAPTTDPNQKLQQRMMQYGLPLMFGVMSFVFPAGLTLYIFTNTILSALHSIYMNKFDKKSLELAAKIKAAQEASEKPKAQGEATRARAADPAKAGEADNDGGAGDEGGANASDRPAGGAKRSKPRNNNKRRR